MPEESKIPEASGMPSSESHAPATVRSLMNPIEVIHPENANDLVLAPESPLSGVRVPTTDLTLTASMISREPSWVAPLAPSDGTESPGIILLTELREDTE